MKIFYHVSRNRLTTLDFNKCRSIGDWGKYICLSTTKDQMKYWQQALHISDPHYYVVLVPDNMAVIDCRGHYLFEYCGDFTTAAETRPHTDMDGEVVVLHGTALLQNVTGLYAVPVEKFEKRPDHYIQKANIFYGPVMPLSKSYIKHIVPPRTRYFIRAIIRQIYGPNFEKHRNLILHLRSYVKFVAAGDNPVARAAINLYYSWQLTNYRKQLDNNL